MEKLLALLEKRFTENMHRHPEVKWEKVQSKLVAQPEKLKSLEAMENSGGEPDVIEGIGDEGMLTFIDCAPESPKERRSLCYDREALESRKKFKPKNSAMDLATEMGIELLTEDEYLMLQQIQPVDTKTSSWIKTPDEVRALGGALFGDYRFGRVFFYHNGAESYYASRGFRGKMIV